MVKIRAVFEKRGRAKYISHLDLNRCMQRTFKRSGLPVWYTEGFNPHIYIMFALPLSLGYESSVELMDFNLTEEVPFEKIVERLNCAMPEGLRVLKAYTPTTKHTGIKAAEYDVRFTGDPSALKEEFKRFMALPEINTIKKTKKGGEKLIDLKPDTEIRGAVEEEGALKITLRLPSGTDKNLNPSLLTDLFEAFSAAKVTDTAVERVGIFTDNGKEFL